VRFGGVIPLGLQATKNATTGKGEDNRKGFEKKKHEGKKKARELGRPPENEKKVPSMAVKIAMGCAQRGIIRKRWRPQDRKKGKKCARIILG